MVVLFYSPKLQPRPISLPLGFNTDVLTPLTRSCLSLLLLLCHTFQIHTSFCHCCSYCCISILESVKVWKNCKKRLWKNCRKRVWYKFSTGCAVRVVKSVEKKKRITGLTIKQGRLRRRQPQGTSCCCKRVNTVERFLAG